MTFIHYSDICSLVSSEVPVHDYFQIFVFQGKIVTTKLYFLDI